MMPFNSLIRIILILTLTVCCLEIIAAPANDEASSPDLSSSLLDGLLDDLDGKLPDLPEVNQPKTLRPPPKPDKPNWIPNADEIQRKIDRDLGGEDVGKKESPLAPIARRMGVAAELISKNQVTEPPRPVQEQVVSELDKLIEQLEKECNACNSSSKNDDKKKQASKRSQPKPSQANKPSQSGKSGSPQSAQSQSASQSSTARMGSAQAVDPETSSNEDLMKAAWGHLPPRLREQMIQSSSEEFLPEYREELKEYFKRLAEREAEEDAE